MKRTVIMFFLASLAVSSCVIDQKQSSQTPLVINTPQVDKALEQLLKKANAGDASAQFKLGINYALGGEGIIKDGKEAVRWFRMAAEQGDVGAQMFLGSMYYGGTLGVIEDKKEAAKWCRMAAEQGESSSQSLLGLMYDSGEGVIEDDKEAVRWYRMAAEQGNGIAQLALGLMYAKGEGVIEDYVEAYKWILLAGVSGLINIPDKAQKTRIGAMLIAKAKEDVADKKAWLKNRMTATQIAEAQRLAKEYVAQKERQSSKTSVPTKQEKDSIKGFGTGFFISQSGYFVTAAHVVEDSSSVQIYWRSNNYPADSIFIDKTLDVAVLKVAGVQSPQSLLLLSSSRVQTGDTVFTLGFPQIQLQGIEPKYTDGSISSLSGMANDPKYFQISVPVQPGNSGGPLLNSQGQVIGLIISRLDDVATLRLTGSVPQNVNYALKGSFILPLLESLPDIHLKNPSNMDKSEAIEKAKNAVALVVCYE